MDPATTRLGEASAALDEGQRRLVDQIAEHGWRSTGVAGREGYAAFTYTTGFWLTFDLPEMIAFDLPAQTCHDLFGLIAGDTAKGRVFRAGEPVPGLIEGEQMWLMPVGRVQADAYLPASRWFYRGDDFPCWQLVWSDSSGRFPWHDGFDAGLVGVQPDLSSAGDWGGLRTTA